MYTSQKKVVTWKLHVRAREQTYRGNDKGQPLSNRWKRWGESGEAFSHSLIDDCVVQKWKSHVSPPLFSFLTFSFIIKSNQQKLKRESCDWVTKGSTSGFHGSPCDSRPLTLYFYLQKRLKFSNSSLSPVRLFFVSRGYFIYKGLFYLRSWYNQTDYQCLRN